VTTTTLDSDELLHLAIKSSQTGQHEQSIDYLKRALEQDPNNANVQYMLGAEHAEIGMYDRAAEEMVKAVQINPDLITAHFQIGLLHITSGRIHEAEEAWKPLDKLQKDNPFYLFKRGLLHLVRDEFAESIADIEQGIKLNQLNQPLNNDMRRILKEITGRNPDLKSQLVESDSETTTQAGHMFLSAYQDKDDT
jgi:tetratricopeptide (TPR) repeat protein